VLDEFQVVLHSPDSIAPVGVLHPTTFHLEKKDSNSLEKKEPGLVFEVQGDGPNTPESTRQPDNGTVEHTRNRVSLSKTGKENTFSICCWLEDSSQSSTGNSRIKLNLQVALPHELDICFSLNRSERRS